VFFFLSVNSKMEGCYRDVVGEEEDSMKALKEAMDIPVVLEGKVIYSFALVLVDC
jgi:hypothetical protein